MAKSADAVVLDETDKALIEALQHDGRMPYTRLADRVGLSEAAVRQRVQRLIESGVCQIVAVTDPLTLGFRRMAMIGLRIEGDLRASADTIASIPEVDYVVIVGGSFDLLLEVVCEDDDHLLALLNDKIRAIPGVRAAETFTYLRLYKQTYAWDAMKGATHTTEELEELARRHLWMHFSRLGSYGPDNAVPIIARGEGCYVWDAHGKRYLDGLSGLFTVQLGHGRHDLAAAAATQAETLEYFPIWTYAHPPAIELAARLAELAPGDLNRVFFTTGGSEAVESAWKLARQFHRSRGEGQRYKVIARQTAYHGTTLGALAITGVPALKTPFEPLTPGTAHVVNTNRYHHPLGEDEKAFMLAVTDAIEEAIQWEGPETVAAVYLEPVQNAGGCIVPPEGYFARVREICDRYGVLLVSDEVICAFGRLGEWFGAERFDYLPDMITCAKGLTSGYSPLGAVICRDHLAEPFLEGRASFAHGITFGGHPVSCAVGLANLDAFESEGVLDNVRDHEDGFRERIEGLRDIPIVGDVRGVGYFLAIELVRDQGTKESFTDAESEDLIRGFLAPRLYDAGLICRPDNRGAPVVQLAPPLIAGDAELDEIESTLRTVLGDAWKRFGT